MSDTNADEAFRNEVRTFLETSLTEELKEAGRKKTSIWQEPESAAAWQQILYKKGVVSTRMAGRIWRHQLVTHATIYILPRVRTRERTRDFPHGSQNVWPHAHWLWH